MKKLSLFLLTLFTAPFASGMVGEPDTAQRMVALTFKDSTRKAFFFISAGMTKKEVQELIKKKTQDAIQQRPKKIQLVSGETFPEIITAAFLEHHAPHSASIQMKVTEYESKKEPVSRVVKIRLPDSDRWV